MAGKKTTKDPLSEKPTATEGKLKALGLAQEQINKQFGDGAIRRLGDTTTVDVELVSSGSLSLDLALGGGYPKGRILEIYGPESSGKTTLTLHAIAEVQKQGGTAAFIDAEHALDPAYARRLGVDTDNLLVSQPDNGEQALEIAETLVRSNAVDLVVVDSVAALVPQAEIDGDMGDSHMGLQARLMSQALRKLTGIISKSKTTVIFINQIRMKIGVMFGNPETTTGGNALKFYASVRLDIRRTGQIKNGEDIIGSRTKVKVVKNKIAPPFRVAEFDIMYNEGISKTGDVLDLAVLHNIVEKSGAWFAYGEGKIGQGREASKEYLKENPKVLSEIEKKVVDMKRAVILHGTNGHPSHNWQPWLKSELEHAGYEVWNPELPGNDRPNRNTYDNFLRQSGWDFAENLVIGHSSGATTVLNLLQENWFPHVKSVVLVGAFLNEKLTKKVEWYEEGMFDSLFPKHGFSISKLKKKSIISISFTVIRTATAILKTHVSFVNNLVVLLSLSKVRGTFPDQLPLYLRFSRY
jgi:recombination protein RecA